MNNSILVSATKWLLSNSRLKRTSYEIFKYLIANKSEYRYNLKWINWMKIQNFHLQIIVRYGVEKIDLKWKIATFYWNSNSSRSSVSDPKLNNIDRSHLIKKLPHNPLYVLAKHLLWVRNGRLPFDYILYRANILNQRDMSHFLSHQEKSIFYELLPFSMKQYVYFLES